MKHRATRTATCEQCGDSFEARTDSAGRFCSVSCWNAYNSGNRHYLYNGGLCLSEGRWVIHCRDGSLMRYSRAVMAAEIGRLLDPEEIVHHVNEDTEDDRPENLQIVTRAEHIEIHRDLLLVAKGL